MATVVTSSSEQQQQQRCSKNGNSTLDDVHQATSLAALTSSSVVYDVEHLATFSTTGSHETPSNINRLVSNDGDGTSSFAANNETSSASSSSASSATGCVPTNATVANSTNTTQPSTTTPKVALQRLFELEKQSGIWTQRMQIELKDDFMLIVDCETNTVVEKFERECVTKPEAFNEYNDIYNNIVVFIIQQKSKPSLSSQKRHEEEVVSDTDLEQASLKIEEGELHIFQCVSHKAQQLVSDILSWKVHSNCQNSDNMANSSSSSTTSENSRDNPSSTQQDIKKINSNQQDQDQRQAAMSNQKSNLNNSASKHKLSPISNKSPGCKPVVTVASSSNTSENVPIVNVNVKETVQVFNQIAALREKSKPTSPINPRPLSDASATSSQSTQAPNSSSSNVALNGPTKATAPIKGPLSPNGHFYKQQSIRATLAPKHASGGDSSTIDAGELPSSNVPVRAVNQSNATSNNNNNKNNSTSSTSSAASSSEPSLLAKSSSAAAYTNLNSSHINNHHQQVSKHHSSGQRVEQQKLKHQHHNHYHHNYPNQQVNEVTPIQSSVSRAPQTSQHQHKHQDQHSHHKSNKSLQSRGQQQRTSQQSDSSRSHASSSQSQLDQVSTNESYVSVLNHCFDDIEKFITRLQQAVAGQTALRDIQSKRKSSKRSGNRTTSNDSSQPMPGVGPSISASELAMLNAKARGPTEDDYFEILSKFKLAFNLLAKLKGCIHEPNAPELVHFLFTPLVIIIESARNATPPIDPTLVGIPYLNQDALDLLSNCCTSKESDVWISLGPNWTQTIDANLLKASRLPSSFQPIFSDGWAPVIGELELIGLVAPSTAANQYPIGAPVNTASLSRDSAASSVANTSAVADDSQNYRHRHHRHRGHGDGRRGHVSSSYGLDELNANPSITSTNPLDSGYSVGMSNGRSVDGLNSHMNGKDHKKKNTPAHQTSSHGRRLVMPDGMIEPGPQSYLNSMPYDYINDPNSALDNHELIASGPRHRDLENSLNNLRSFNQPVNGRQSRGIKTNPRHSELPIHPGFDPTQYPPMSYHRQLSATDVDSRPDMDFIAHRNASTLQSDDYNELPENFLEDHVSKNLPGPSNHYYREDKSHSNSRYPHKGHKNVYSQDHSFPPYDSEYLSETDHEAMLLDLGPAQTEWFFELQARGAMIVRVLYTRDANNEKELSVCRGEILEVLDDTRKWWRTRNIDLQVAHVPHTIVAIMHGYQTLEELLIENPSDFDGKDPSTMTSQQYTRRELHPDNYNRDQWRGREDRRGSKTSGPFRYF